MSLNVGLQVAPIWGMGRRQLENPMLCAKMSVPMSVDIGGANVGTDVVRHWFPGPLGPWPWATWKI
eukprot:3330457-Karenia_brevis.AAC.1